MKIRITTWHYRLYRSSYISQMPPKKTSVCQYLGRIAFTAIPLFVFIWAVLAPIFLVLTFAIFPLAYLLLFLGCSLFGWKPEEHYRPIRFLRRHRSYSLASSFDMDTHGIRYKPFRVGTLSFYPWHILLPVTIIAGIAMSFHYAPATSGWILGGLAALTLLAFLAWKLAKFAKSEHEIVKLIRALLHGIKEKTCVLVEFEESNQGEKESQESKSALA